MTGARVRPPPLTSGQRVAVVAPSGVVDPVRLDAGLARLRAWGFEPAPGRHVLARHGYLAGTDDERAADLRRAFDDDTVGGVICARGGYGAQRLVDRLDYDAVRRRPKAFAGFSDVTALHLALGRHAGLVTFHGPNLAADPGRLEAPAAASLCRALTAAVALGQVGRPHRGGPVATLSPGVGEGPLVGGNLSLLAAAAGTPEQPVTDGCLLLVEDVGERPYRVERMLTQLRRAGVLEAVAGVVVGACVGCEETRPGCLSFSLREVLGERLGGLGVPAVYGLALGHGPDQQTVPLGVRARLDADRGTLTLLEPATAPHGSPPGRLS